MNSSRSMLPSPLIVALLVFQNPPLIYHQRPISSNLIVYQMHAFGLISKFNHIDLVRISIN